MIRIGKIKGPWGRVGELEVKSYSPFPERFSKLKEIFIGGDSYKIEKIRYFSKKIVMKLEGITSRETAMRFRSAEMEIPEEEIYLLPKDYFYLHDLKGCLVFLKDGKELGIVDSIWEIGESTLLIVSGEKGEILIPFAKSICYLLDIEGRRIEIDPPDGLIDLNEI